MTSYYFIQEQLMSKIWDMRGKPWHFTFMDIRFNQVFDQGGEDLADDMWAVVHENSKSPFRFQPLSPPRGQHD